LFSAAARIPYYRHDIHEISGGIMWLQKEQIYPHLGQGFGHSLDKLRSEKTIPVKAASLGHGAPPGNRLRERIIKLIFHHVRPVQEIIQA
jgi:hypothetical protein